MRYQSELLDDHHRLKALSSGNRQLDEWLTQYARHAAEFYQHHGFIPSPDDAHHLVQEINDIARSLGIP